MAETEMAEEDGKCVYVYENWTPTENSHKASKTISQASNKDDQFMCPCCRRPCRRRVDLACVHWLCRKCAAKATQGLSMLVIGHEGNYLLCPFCHQTTTLVRRPKDGRFIIAKVAQRCPKDTVRCIDKLRLMLADLGRRRSSMAAAAAEAERARAKLAAEAVQDKNESWDKDEVRRRSRLTAMSGLLWRLCLLRQCEKDLDHLIGLAAAAFAASSASAQTDLLPRLSSSLSALGNTLDRLSQSPRRPASTCSSSSSSNGKVATVVVCLDLSAPLYEKVLCRVPAIAIAIGHDQRQIDLGNIDFVLSINGIPVPQTDVQCVSHTDGGHCWTHLCFAPPFAGRATLSGHAGGVKKASVYAGHSSSAPAVVVYPSSFPVKALTLDNHENKGGPGGGRAGGEEGVREGHIDFGELFSL
jgi:hypothetical protein